jgi:hypothetical protein
MQLKSLKKQLIATTGVSSLLAAGIFGWAFWNSPVDIPAVSGTSLPPSSNGNSVTKAGSSKQKFEDLWNIELRGPRKPSVPVGEPARTPSIAATLEPRFAIQLLGTMIEGTQAVGIFADSSGGFDDKSVGEVLELSPHGVLISRIEPGVAIVTYNGREIRLEISNAAPVTGVPVSTNAQSNPTNGEGEISDSSPAMQPPMVPAPMNYGGVQPAPASDTDDLSAPLPANMDPANDFSGYQRAFAPKPEKGPMP